MFHLLNYCASDLDLIQLSLDFITDDLILACEYYIGVILLRKVYTHTPFSQKYAHIFFSQNKYEYILSLFCISPCVNVCTYSDRVV